MVDEMKVNNESRLSYMENKMKEMEKTVAAVYPILMEMPPPNEHRHKRGLAPGFAESTQYSTAEEGKSGNERLLSPAAGVQHVNRHHARGPMRSGCPSTEFETLAQYSARGGALDESGVGRDRSTLEPVEGMRPGNVKDYMRVEERDPLGRREEEKVQVLKS